VSSFAYRDKKVVGVFVRFRRFNRVASLRFLLTFFYQVLSN
jgi:hypothetical protein